MRHCRNVTKSRLILLAESPLTIKYEAKLEIVDRLVLAQRQAAWKTPFPIGYEPGEPSGGGTGTTGGTGTGTGTV